MSNLQLFNQTLRITKTSFVCIYNWLYFCFSTMKYQFFVFCFSTMKYQMFPMQDFFLKKVPLIMFSQGGLNVSLCFYSLHPVNSNTSSNTCNHATSFVVVMTIIIHSMGFPETIGYEHICVGKWFIFSPSLVRRMACVSL